MTQSLAVGQKLVGDADAPLLPLFPPLVYGAGGVPPKPVEVVFPPGASPSTHPPLPGLERWSATLPPLLPGLSMAEGGTPLHADRLGGVELYLKDETRNPTGSHKDRLNLCAVSGAVLSGARGIALASSGNHATSAAAYARRAGLPTVAIVGEATPPPQIAHLRAHGAFILRTRRELRWALLDAIARGCGYQPVSSPLSLHTGHPFGVEGYKTIAYELSAQLNCLPGTVYVPTGHGELLFGLAKGFAELVASGSYGAPAPQLVACEPASRAPLALAVRTGVPFAEVPERPTEAYGIGVTRSSIRSRVALELSQGRCAPADEAVMEHAQRLLASRGHWVERSGAAGLAGLLVERDRGIHPRGPVVVLLTGSGFKDLGVCASEAHDVVTELTQLPGILSCIEGLS